MKPHAHLPLLLHPVVRVSVLRVERRGARAAQPLLLLLLPLLLPQPQPRRGAVEAAAVLPLVVSVPQPLHLGVLRVLGVGRPRLDRVLSGGFVEERVSTRRRGKLVEEAGFDDQRRERGAVRRGARHLGQVERRRLLGAHVDFPRRELPRVAPPPVREVSSRGCQARNEQQQRQAASPRAQGS